MNIFYCKHCKRIVYTYFGGGTLTCCGEEMTLLQPKTMDQGNEKHLPVVDKAGALVGMIDHIQIVHADPKLIPTMDYCRRK